MTNVLKPIEEPYPQGVAEIFESYPQVDGYILKLFRTFANSLRFLKEGVPNLLDKESPLPIRQREIVILGVTANNDCEYEWGVHVAAFGAQVKLTEDQVRATRLEDHRAGCWSSDEALLIEAVDELYADGTLSDRTLAAIQQVWTAEQQLEILALCGTYHTVSFVANAGRVENEEFGARFPA